MKKTTKITTLKEEKYNLSDKIDYIINYKNGKEVDRLLKYKGGDHYGYSLTPVYKLDLSLLSETNPFWKDYDWFKGDVLPEPDKIDMNKIILVQTARHHIYDIDLKPLPIVQFADYIDCGFNNEEYHLKKLREYLLTNDKIVKISEIMDIPSYNANKGCNKYIEVLYIADSDFLQSLLDSKEWIRYSVAKYLNIEEFKKEDKN
jgi:hypothetical protein